MIIKWKEAQQEEQKLQYLLFWQICQIWLEAVFASSSLICSSIAWVYPVLCQVLPTIAAQKGEEKLAKWKRFLKKMCIHHLTMHCLPEVSTNHNIITFLHKLPGVLSQPILWIHFFICMCSSIKTSLSYETFNNQDSNIIGKKCDLIVTTKKHSNTSATQYAPVLYYKQFKGSG